MGSERWAFDGSAASCEAFGGAGWSILKALPVAEGATIGAGVERRGGLRAAVYVMAGVKLPKMILGVGMTRIADGDGRERCGVVGVGSWRRVVGSIFGSL